MELLAAKKTDIEPVETKNGAKREWLLDFVS